MTKQREARRTSNDNSPTDLCVAGMCFFRKVQGDQVDCKVELIRLENYLSQWAANVASSCSRKVLENLKCKSNQPIYQTE